MTQEQNAVITLEVVKPQEPAVFPMSTAVKRTVSVKGTSRVSLLPRKEWKLANAASLEGLSNRAIKAEYEAYRLLAIESSTQGLQALVASGVWGAESYSQSKDGNKLRVTLVNKNASKGLVAAEADRAIDKLDTEQLKALQARLTEMLSA